jgi:hypothetical protein
MGSIFRDLIMRVFGSDQVDVQYSSASSPTTPVAPAAAPPAPLPAEAPGTPNEMTERRGTQSLALRPAPQAE